ncbi:DUF2309 domain-containing protein [Bradyrhizobium sp. BR13661]|jgi:uncharacterized protein YbcC (UPF0753/DUF2309 family)|uniref:YbcC family protein n=1 Tax=Bradyrhizobium sp. BR13661 TaxID=2940622 RepID=UPI00247380D8|nr:DUF2309 domain-containing protein [Bradyrhizobium sp. BR13661]MDH6257545.1 uncharacterized protein YbcC (UPF0753/DUF2309 family) [Bradyrhizobium sp. BR13661]
MKSRNNLDHQIIHQAAARAARSIPPLWPLASSVAVNPFLGQTDESLAQTSSRLQRVVGTSATMPRSWYANQLAAGFVTDGDLMEALANAPEEFRPADLVSLRAVAAEAGAPGDDKLPNLADLASNVSGIDWCGIIADRFGAWAGGYFDQGQALWSAPHSANTYADWRAFAVHDLTPEIMGLAGFASHVSQAPPSAADAIVRATKQLGLSSEALDTYFHQLLMTLGGWSQYARYKLWQAELAGSSDETIIGMLAIRLIWEEAFQAHYAESIAQEWKIVRRKHELPVSANENTVLDAILQESCERAFQRRLSAVLGSKGDTTTVRPILQIAFCIDVRSEVFRRALESTSPDIQTLGFAGFFGLTISHRSFASDVPELRLPVLLNPNVTTSAGGFSDNSSDVAARIRARAKRAWGRFKLAAVSSFAFVEATGPVYLGKLLGDALGLSSSAAQIEPQPRFDPEIDLTVKVDTAETILRAMSLTRDFARFVCLAGHAATVVNNPHASALNCGACGGYGGDVNARSLASLLNDSDVRCGLVAKGIEIPADTRFVGALHDTTTDRVVLYASDHPRADHLDDLKKVKGWLSQAGKLARLERASRLPGASGQRSVIQRSRNWAEVRPEWGLAGCAAFIAAPRARTLESRLDGRAFLHDYVWTKDKNFSVLELIMTAPVVVASWISLQYYGSTVAPDVFGAGNKLLHNVTGGIGVIEGNSGSIRTGLPWQSIHDGQKYMHDPLRLSVCIEAPREAMNDVLSRHKEVRALFDNGWLHLFALDDQGRMAWRYAGDLNWTSVASVQSESPEMEIAV